jgi:hypothetical protein
MSGAGYLVAAYIGAGLLYGGYVAWLRSREHSLARGVRRTEDRG